ncbi:MAG: PQQ-binding-like beta-propeller repeat protein [Acidobacteria bacterium]|nr:PQQ-binding-like beta-propeller repeat protein [Acidobacteriota bacterium]
MRAVTCVLFILGLAPPALAQDGGALYAQYCARCHDAGQPRTPARLALTQLAPEAIVAALETGSMRVQGAERTAAERRALAAFLSGKAIGETPAPPPLKMCAAPAPAASANAPNWSGWGLSLANDRFQRAPNLKADDVSKLKLKWAFAFSGDASAAVQPSVVGDRVFVGSVTGRIYSLSLRDGCVYWTFDAGAMVRTAVDVGDAGGSSLAFFGDVAANVYAVDVATGALRWKRRVDPHIVARVTGTPKFYRGRVYVPVSSVEEVIGASPQYPCCTFRGSVVALDAATGEVAWKTFAIPEAPVARRKNQVGTQFFGPSGAAIWSSPTIDEKAQVLYVATGDSYSDPPAETSDAIMAMDLQTGAIKWAQQMTKGDAFNLACGAADSTNCPDSRGPDVDFGSPPILVTLPSGTRALVIGQKSAVVHALDPDDGGKLRWATRIGRGGALGGVEWGSAADGQNIYVPLSDIAFKQAALDINGMTPNGAIGGGLFALKLSDGKEAWHVPIPGCGDRPRCSPAQSAPASVIDGIVFSGSVDGHMRGYSTRDGHIVWDFDTAQEYTTVNGSKARGGSIDVGGPAIANGVLLTTSGYAQWGGLNGNVLLAFSVDGK